MTPSRPEPRFSAFLLLGAVAALSLAGCAPAPEGKSSLFSSSTATGPAPLGNLSDLPNKERSLLKVAEASRASGDCGTAVRFYRMAADKEEKPANVAAARLGAGECELAMGAMGDATGDFQAAMKLLPQDPMPLVGLGRIYLVQHKPGDAATYFDLAIKKGANDAFVWNDKGVAFDQLGRHKEAQEAYRHGLSNAAGDTALRSNLALSLAMTGDFHEAENLLRNLVSEPNATARTRQNLALVLGLEGDRDGARRVSEADLDGAALDNNERFYDYARDAIVGGGSMPTASLSDTRATAVPARTARAVSPVPPPVLVPRPRAPAAPVQTVAAEPLPSMKLRTAEPEIFEPPPPSEAATHPASPMVARLPDPAPPAPVAAATPAPAPTPQPVAETAPTVAGHQTADVGQPVHLGPPPSAAGPVASSENE